MKSEKSPLGIPGTKWENLRKFLKIWDEKNNRSEKKKDKNLFEEKMFEEKRSAKEEKDRTVSWYWRQISGQTASTWPATPHRRHFKDSTVFRKGQRISAWSVPWHSAQESAQKCRFPVNSTPHRWQTCLRCMRKPINQSTNHYVTHSTATFSLHNEAYSSHQTTFRLLEVTPFRSHFVLLAHLPEGLTFWKSKNHFFLYDLRLFF